ncbi:hypothetical protein B0T17DRAFT_611503 [Bombardia bombarda]|uniref:Defect at low temperature protein 1 n=1 Tax=Bombardia bombarda TaxID=252184 RepID=A0AA40CEJ2_9PEZI|nr:hypothetical protein B0T17DRAFT_611503 [Bombardia bombarda]
MSIFRILYNLIYYLLYLVLLAFLLVTPGDLLRQAVERRQSYNILVISITYLVTILLVAFIYATRLYLGRSVLASIPKQSIPIVDKGDVRADVREMIVAGLSRSAAIAFEARPRSGGQGHNNDDDGIVVVEIPQQPAAAVWGNIEHPGWASPLSADLPNLQYDTVISELPNLIEAKALTLAPVSAVGDPEASGGQQQQPMLDPEAVGLLQRLDVMGLREYLGHLAALAVLVPDQEEEEEEGGSSKAVVADFIARYEYARYSARPISEADFRELMHLFAEVLRSMQPLSEEVLERFAADGGADDDDDDDDESYDDGDGYSSRSRRDDGRQPLSESDIDNDAPRGTSPSSAGSTMNMGMPGDNHSQISPRGSSGSMLRLPSRSRNVSTRSSEEVEEGASTRNYQQQQQLRPGMIPRNSSANTTSWQYRTAPTTPKSRHTGRLSSSEWQQQQRQGGQDGVRFPSGDNTSFGPSSPQMRLPPFKLGSRASNASLRSSVRSGVGSSLASGSGGSVIRLAVGSEEAGSGLPYVLMHPQSI